MNTNFKRIEITRNTVYLTKELMLHYKWPTTPHTKKHILGMISIFLLAKMHDHHISFFKAYGSVELCSFCEGYFLQQMSALLERESFRSLLLGPPGARQGNNTFMLVHSRVESPLEELEATLAQRLRSLYVSSRV